MKEEEGKLVPLLIQEGGEQRTVTDILDICRMVSRKDDSMFLSYKCLVDGKPEYLLYSSGH